MKLLIYKILLISSLAFIGCQENKNNTMDNPFLQSYTHEYEIPPFDKIKNEHFKPAFEKAFEQQNKEVESIINNSQKPTFENTIAELEYSGELLKKVGAVFFNYLSAITSPELQTLAEEISPEYTKHVDNINLNEKLFEKIKAIHDGQDNLKLNSEQKIVLKNLYNSFVRGGAGLSETDRNRFRAINEKLSLLTLKFGDNVLTENNEFELVIDNKKDLAGLPESAIASAAEEATNRKLENKWVFTLQAPSYFPFMQYAENRALREKMYLAYTSKGSNGNKNDNNSNIVEIVNLRAERAQLLGYPNHAAYTLEESMAKTPEQVNTILEKLWKATLPVVHKEQEALQKIADEEKAGFAIQAWDWSYYSEKLKKQAYDFDEEVFRPYLSLDKVTEGVFLACKKLYGIEFVKRANLPSYHPDAIPYEVKEADGRFIGIIYMDFFPRASKSGGAWMTSYRDQYIARNGQHITPIISIVCNFSKPTENTPSLLNFDELTTYFHEFGHALHGLLSNVHYPSVSGTNVYRDYVEFPSQIFENWATESNFLKEFAFHYQTGEVIPDSLIEKYLSTSKFNQGFATTEYLAASILDMQFHTLDTKSPLKNASELEKNAMKNIGLVSTIAPRYRSTYFNHIFSGGYSAGYYSYIWAEMLDADGFEYFKKKGIFDPATALSYRKNILEKGGTADPMELYKSFRGQEPTIGALLERRGLNHSEVVQQKH
ncbi:MAG TPA: M3 family metallopeptidase [Chitinophagales bacterium]|nr:M3 family metallopeptidase [Chitinophagales bacterium]